MPLYAVIAFVIAIEALPAVQYGPWVLILALPSCVTLCLGIAEFGKRLLRIARSRRTVGVVVRLDYVLDTRGGSYCAVVGYHAGSGQWEVRDRERVMPETSRLGDPATVYYDPLMPGNAMLYCPLPVRPTLLISAGVVLYCGSWLMGAQNAGGPPLWR
jgi:hypothetical protein